MSAVLKSVFYFNFLCRARDVQEDSGLLLYKHMHAHMPTLFSLSLSSYSCTELLIVSSCFLSPSLYGWLTIFDREVREYMKYIPSK